MKSSELKSYIKEIIISELSETTMVGPKTDPTKIPDIAKSERTDQNTVRTALNRAKQTNTTVSVAEVNDDDDVVDQKAMAAAEKNEGNAEKLAKITSHLKEVEKNMKHLAEKWKQSEGEEKENILNKLKEKTKIKKELKALQDKYAESIV